MHQADRAAHVEALARAPENVRTVIEEHEPEPPPGFGPLATVLAAGALAGFMAGAARGELQLARRLVMQDELAAAASPLLEPHSSPSSAAPPLLFAKVGDPSAATYCTKDSDCGSGQKCDRGRCIASAHKPPRPSPRQKPRLVADIGLRPLGDHQALPQLYVPVSSPY